MSEILKTLYRKLINYFRKDVAEKQLERITEIQCTPTFWRFMETEEKLLFDWNMVETIQLIDYKKMNKLRIEHLRVDNPNKSEVEIAEETAWGDIENILKHLKQNHFDEIKREVPKNIVTGTANFAATIVGIKNILSNESIIFPQPKHLLADDQIVFQIRAIEWNVVYEILKKEPA